MKSEGQRLEHFIEALHDERVIRALEMALRDARIRRRFRVRRREVTVAAA